MACIHYHDGTCDLGLYGRRPSHGVCVICPRCTDREGHKEAAKASLVVLTVAPVPVDRTDQSKWPLWAAKLAKCRGEADKGVGDTLARQIGPAGEAFKGFMQKMGIDCGCSRRQEYLNGMYPY